jgi:hypothetical protein
LFRVEQGWEMNRKINYQLINFWGVTGHHLHLGDKGTIPLGKGDGIILSYPNFLDTRGDIKFVQPSIMLFIMAHNFPKSFLGREVLFFWEFNKKQLG